MLEGNRFYFKQPIFDIFEFKTSEKICVIAGGGDVKVYKLNKLEEKVSLDLIMNYNT